MASFRYIAVTATGERVSGSLAGASEQAVLAELESRRLTPVRVHEHKGRGVGGAASVWSRGISTRQLAGAYTQIADLLRAGVPLLRALRLIGGRKSSPRLGQVFNAVADDVAEGAELSEAFAARNGESGGGGGGGEVFGKVHIALVRAGEKGGFLEAVLARLGAFLTAQAEMRAKVIGNLIYPAVLVAAVFVVSGLVFGVFVPRFRPLFARLEASGDLPALTRGVLAASGILNRYGVWIAIGVLILAAVLWASARTASPALARRWAVLKLRLPVIGPLTRAIATARFCRILGTMLGNAIPMIAAMQIARDAAGNAVLEEAIDKAVEAVKQGQALAPPLAASGLFADDVCEMISVGEAANNLDEVLLTTAATLETRVERMLSVAVKLIEPLILIVLGLLVGLVAAALILPMSKLSQAVGS